MAEWTLSSTQNEVVKIYTLAASPLGKGPKYPLNSMLNQPVGLNVLGKVKSLPLSKIKKQWSSS